VFKKFAATKLWANTMGNSNQLGIGNAFACCAPLDDMLPMFKKLAATKLWANTMGNSNQLGIGNKVACCDTLDDMLRRGRRDAVRLHDAVELVVATIAGDSWRVWADEHTTCADLKRRVGALSQIPILEITLLHSGCVIADDAVVLQSYPVLRQVQQVLQQPQLNMVRSRFQALCTSSQTGQLHLFHLDRPIKTFGDSAMYITCVSVDWNLDVAFTASFDGKEAELRLWDMDRGACINVYKTHSPKHDKPIRCMAVNWTLRRAIIGTGDGVIRQYDLQNHACITLIKNNIVHQNSWSSWFDMDCVPVLDLAVDWREKVVLASTDIPVLVLWNLDDSSSSQVTAGSVRSSNMKLIEWSLEQHGVDGLNRIRCLALDWGQRKAINCTVTGEIKLWDLAGNVECCGTMVHPPSIMCCRPLWDEQQVLSGAGDGSFRLWDLQSLTCVMTYQEDSEPPCSVRCMAVGSKRNYVAVGYEDRIELLSFHSSGGSITKVAPICHPWTFGRYAYLSASVE